MRALMWITFAVGLWLIAAPFLLGYAGASRVAMGEDIVMGILIALFSLWVAAGTDTMMGQTWLLLLFGIWTLIAPFVLAYSRITAAQRNDLSVGIIVIVLSLVRATAAHPRPVHVSGRDVGPDNFGRTNLPPDVK